MPKPVSPAWVKNVYKLRTPRGISRGFLSTQWHLRAVIAHGHVDNRQVLPSLIPAFSQVLSTARIRISYLLDSLFTPNPQALLLLRQDK